MDTPLSAVKIILFLSFFSSSNALCSSLVMLYSGGCTFFRMALTSPLNSSASPHFNCVQACSMDAMYFSTGRHLGTIAKFCPWDNTFTCTSVKGVIEIFLIHVLLVGVELVEMVGFSLFLSVYLVLVLSLESNTISVVKSSWSPCWMFEWPPSIFLHFWHNLWNFIF